MNRLATTADPFPPREPVIRLAQVSKRVTLPGGCALDAVGPTSLEIAADDLFGGVGKSGAGKSRCCA